MYRHLFCVWIISQVFCQLASGQNFASFHYSTAEGLPSSETYDIIQDKSGYIWIATDRGVSRFNGYEFENFTTHDGLVENTVFNIHEDSKGRIWFLSISGYLCYYENGKIEEFKWNAKITEEKKFIIRSFHCDVDNTITIGTYGNGIISIDSAGRIRNAISVPKAGRMSFVISYRKGNLQVGVKSGEPTLPGEKTVNIIAQIGNQRIIKKIEYNKSNSNISGIVRRSGKLLVRFPGVYFSNEISDTLINEPFETIRLYEDRDSSLWVSYRNGGVRRYAPNAIVQSSEFETYFKNEIITSIFQDQEGGYWFSTLFNGIFYVPSVNFRYFSVPDRFFISELCSYHDGVTVGYSNGIIEGFLQNRKSFRYNTNSTADSISHVFGLSQANGSIFVSNSLRTFLYSNGKRKDFRNALYVRSPVYNKDKIYGCANFKIVVFDTATMETAVQHVLKIRTDNLYIDKKGKFWIGDYTGLYSISQDTLFKEFENMPLFNSRVSGISETSNGFLAVATIGEGLLISKGEKIIQVSDENGLISNVVNCLFVDGNIIWLGTNKGISRISIENDGRFSVRNFTNESGLPEIEFYHILKCGDLIWSASKNKIVYFDPSELKLNEVKPNIFINKINANGRLVSANGKAIFRLDDFPLHIDFLGLSLKKRGNIMYKFRIVGFNDSWNYTTNRFVEFYSLPAGDYSFEVLAMNEDGFWSPSAAVFKFRVVPPYYLTWWFYSLMALFLIMIMVMLFYLQIRKIQRKNKIQADLMNFRQQALAGQINPHFMHNALNSIQSFIMTDDKRSASKYLSRFSSLMRKSLEHSRREMVTISEEAELLETYVSLEQLRFDQKFQFEIVIDYGVNKDQWLIPAMLIQPFVENSILHGINESDKPDLKIKVVLSIKENVLTCEVWDNGIGINRSVQLKKNSKAEKKSAGVSITIERLKALCKSMNQPFYYRVTDASDTDSLLTGTRVIFTIPYSQNNKKHESNFN